MKAFNALFILIISFSFCVPYKVASAAPIPPMRSLEAKDLEQHVKEYKAVSGLGADIFERKTLQRRVERVTSFARDDSPAIDSSTSEVTDSIKDLITTPGPVLDTLGSALADIIGSDNSLPLTPDVGEITDGTNIDAPNNLAELLSTSENAADASDFGQSIGEVDDQAEAGGLERDIHLLDD